MKPEIVIADDEKEIANLVGLYLTNENYIVHIFYDGKSAYEHIQKQPPNLAILDIMMPEMDGMTLCLEIRKHYTFPVILLTAKDSEMDKINGLTLGADDYITKPFTPMEMVARVKAQLRRSHFLNQEDSLLQFEGLTLDSKKHICLLNDKEIVLTPKEFDILCILCKNKGLVIPTEELFERVWKEDYLKNSNNTVMVHIRHLREKLNDTGEKTKYIQTVWGVGYKIGK